MATAQKYGVRKYLTDSGYKDSDISWDPNRNMVTLQGKDFMAATPEADQRTYGTMEQLGTAMRNFNQMQQQAKQTQRNDQLDTLVPMLTQKATAAPQAAFTPAPYTGFNPNTNASFQAAKANVFRDAQTGQNNAMVGLGARGIGNSSVAVDRANQIQQGAVAKINNDLLPQYEQMDYGRYRDTVGDQVRADESNYSRGQNQMQALDGLVKFLVGQNQQDFSNEMALGEASRARKNDNWNAYLDSVGLTGNLGTGPKDEWGLLGGTDGPLSLTGQQFQYGKDKDALAQAWRAVQELGYVPEGLAQLVGLPAGTQTLQNRQVSASIANANADNARAGDAAEQSKNNAQTQVLMDIWEKTGFAPPGIPGVAQGTPIASMAAPKPKDYSYKSDPEFAADVQILRSDPKQAEYLNTNAQDYIEAYGYDGYLALRKEVGLDKDSSADILRQILTR